jgi:hypothetical protein
MKNAPTKQYVTAKNPLQTETFTMPADFKKNQRLIYYCDKTNKQYDIENLIAENLELNRELNACRNLLRLEKASSEIANELLKNMGESKETALELLKKIGESDDTH